MALWLTVFQAIFCYIIYAVCVHVCTYVYGTFAPQKVSPLLKCDVYIKNFATVSLYARYNHLTATCICKKRFRYMAKMDVVNFRLISHFGVLECTMLTDSLPFFRFVCSSHPHVSDKKNINAKNCLHCAPDQLHQ